MSIMVVMKVVGVSITLCTILALSRALPLNSTAPTGSCAAARQNCSSNLPIGQFCPTCDANGNYLPKQCSGSTGYCWCVNITTGQEVPGTMTPPGAPLQCGLCKKEQSNCSLAPGAFCPACDANGNFLPKQCSGSTGYCWCVNITTGQEIPGTMTPPGHQLNCTMEQGSNHHEGQSQDEEPGTTSENSHNENQSSDPDSGNESHDAEEEDESKEPTSDSECDGCGNESHDTEEEDESKEPDSECEGCGSEGPCPSGWSRFTDHCYMFVNTPKTWTEAEVYCQFDGANLASVHSDQGNHFIMSLTRGDTQDFPQAWLGGFDAIHPGFWMWSDGSEFDYSNWAETHDDGDWDKKKKNCLKINYEYDLKWFYASCGEPMPFVCAKSISAPPDHPKPGH